MWARTTLLWYFLASAFAVCVVGKAMADIMSALFQDGVPGYDTGPGITIQSRLHPEQQPFGVREGAFKFMPNLEEGVGYSSNAVSGPSRRGSWETIDRPGADHRVRLGAGCPGRGVVGAGYAVSVASQREPC